MSLSPGSKWSMTQPKLYQQPKQSSLDCSEDSTDPQALLRFFRQEGRLVACDLDHRCLQHWGELSPEAACQALREYANQPKQTLDKPPAYFMQLLKDVQATSQKAKKSKQSVGQVLLHALAPDTQQLLQQLHEQGRIADHELDTVCYTRLAATAPELQVAVLKAYINGKDTKRLQSNMAFFQQLTKTIPSRSPQPSPKQREPPGLGLFQDLSNLYPAVNTNPSTNPHAVQTSNAPGTSNEQLAVSPVSHASSAHVDWPHQPEVTQADTDQLAAADAVEAAEKGDATASELTQAAPANEDPSSEDIWEILLRQAQGSADPQPSNSDPPPATGSSEFSSAPTPSALDAPVIPAAAPASGSGTLQQARRKSSLSVFATVEQLTPTPAEQSRSTPAPQSNDLPAHIAAAYSMPPIQPAQMQRTHTSTQPAGAISSPQVALPVQCPARLQDTNGPRQPSDMSTSAQVGLPLPYGKPISQNDLNKLLDPGCWMYNEELCMSWRVLTKEEKLHWQIMLSNKKNKCRLSKLSQARQQLAQQLHPKSAVYDVGLASRWKQLRSNEKDSLLLLADRSGHTIEVADLQHANTVREFEVQGSDFPALPSLQTQAADTVHNSGSPTWDSPDLRAAQQPEGPIDPSTELQSVKAAQQSKFPDSTSTDLQAPKTAHKLEDLPVTVIDLQAARAAYKPHIPALPSTDLQATRAAQQSKFPALTGTDLQAAKAARMLEFPPLTIADLQAARAPQSDVPALTSAAAKAAQQSWLPALTNTESRAARTAQKPELPFVTSADLKAARAAHNADIPALTSIAIPTAKAAQQSGIPALTVADLQAARAADIRHILPAPADVGKHSMRKVTQDDQGSTAAPVATVTASPTRASFLPPKPQPEACTNKPTVSTLSSMQSTASLAESDSSAHSLTTGAPKPSTSAQEGTTAATGRYVIPDRRKAYTSAANPSTPAYMPL